MPPDWGPSDMAFHLFLTTLLPSDFCEWEWRLFNYYRLRAETRNK